MASPNARRLLDVWHTGKKETRRREVGRLGRDQQFLHRAAPSSGRALPGMTANIIAAMPRILSPFIVSFPACGGKIVARRTHPKGGAFFIPMWNSFWCSSNAAESRFWHNATNRHVRSNVHFQGQQRTRYGPLIRLPRGAPALARQGLRDFDYSAIGSRNGDRRGRCSVHS